MAAAAPIRAAARVLAMTVCLMGNLVGCIDPAWGIVEVYASQEGRVLVARITKP